MGTRCCSPSALGGLRGRKERFCWSVGGEAPRGSVCQLCCTGRSGHSLHPGEPGPSPVCLQTCWCLNSNLANRGSQVAVYSRSQLSRPKKEGLWLRITSLCYPFVELYKKLCLFKTEVMVSSTSACKQTILQKSSGVMHHRATF